MDKKTIWITGGSTGIGKALAIKFAKEGWNVAISARRENLLKETCGEHENISSFPLDVTDKSKCKEVFQNIVNTFHNVDICFPSHNIIGSHVVTLQLCFLIKLQHSS